MFHNYSESIPAGLLSYDLAGGATGLALTGMDITGRLSLTLTGLPGGTRLPMLLIPRGGKLRGSGRLHEGLETLPELRPERKSPRPTCFP